MHLRTLVAVGLLAGTVAMPTQAATRAKKATKTKRVTTTASVTTKVTATTAAPATSVAPASTQAPTTAPTVATGGATLDAIKKKGKIAIGVKQNVPLIGLKNPVTGDLQGFDIEIAKIVARAIFGTDKDHIQWEDASVSANRIPFITDNKVDLVIATFSITDDRKKQIDMAGPYYVAGQDILVYKVDLPNIKSVDDLNGRKVCAQSASTSLALLKTKIGTPRDLITTLSGGNQQKVIIARWLLRDAKVLIMDEPTRGIDVNAKYEIQAVLRRLTEEKGLSIILISSEMEEVLDVADRILVMHEGRSRGIVEAKTETQETLLKRAMT